MPKDYRLKLIESKKSIDIKRDDRKVETVKPVRANIEAKTVLKALTASPGGPEVIKQIPNANDVGAWTLTAVFCVCQKTGTALFLDIWDADHFDGLSDMQHSLADCRAWFSSDEFEFWGSGKTKTGRVNCYFTAPSAGNYVCTAELQSYGGPALVECLIDSSSFGFLPVNGSINQPHPCVLSAGGHSFRIRQVSGSFFFIAVGVWKV